jgi:HK97 gp10 family phage protein
MANARVIKQLKAIKDIEVSMLTAAQYIAKRAREYAAVDTGYMREHTRAKKTGPKTAAVEASAPYSGYVEFGTYKASAQPFIRPAIAEGRREIPKLTAKEVNAEIRRRVSSA